jgi:hypothetical protein
LRAIGRNDRYERRNAQIRIIGGQMHARRRGFQADRSQSSAAFKDLAC